MPLALPPVWDIDTLVAEVQRVAAKGCHAITMPELPYLLDLPSYQNEHWDPFWVVRRGIRWIPSCWSAATGITKIRGGPVRTSAGTERRLLQARSSVPSD